MHYRYLINGTIICFFIIDELIIAYADDNFFPVWLMDVIIGGLGL